MRFGKADTGRDQRVGAGVSAINASSNTLAITAHGSEQQLTAKSPALTNRDLVLQAFETSYEHVARYIALRIGDRDMAEDLASEVFVRALDKAHTYKPGDKPIQAWLFRIAHNLMVDHLRRKSRTGVAVPLDEMPEIPTEDDADAAAQQEADVKTLSEALSVLTDSERQVISMRFAGEMRPDEIGRALGKSSGAVRWLQHSAVGKLRKHLNLEAMKELVD